MDADEKLAISVSELYIHAVTYGLRRGTNREYSILCLQLGIFSIARREGERKGGGRGRESFVSRVEILFASSFEFFLPRFVNF